MFDVFRKGFNTGYRAGLAGRRRRAAWELFLTTPVLWLLWLVDRPSFYMGYRVGFERGAIAAKMAEAYTI